MYFFLTGNKLQIDMKFRVSDLLKNCVIIICYIILIVSRHFKGTLRELFLIQSVFKKNNFHILQTLKKNNYYKCCQRLIEGK